MSKTENPGRFIKNSVANKMIKKYFAYRRELKEKHDVPWNKQKDHYAYCFGLEEMRQLIAKADAYNEGKPEFPAVGIRVYNTRTLSDVDPKDDVLMIPYLSNHKNMGPVDEELDNNGEEIIYTDENDEEDALNDPIFCPPFCN